MIVSLPNVAVNPVAAKTPIASPSPVGAFLAALVNATSASDTTPATNGNPAPIGNGKGMIATKDGKGLAASQNGKADTKSSKPSSISHTPIPALNPLNNDVTKMLASVPMASPLTSASRDEAQKVSESDSDPSNSENVAAPASDAGVQPWSVPFVPAEAAQSTVLPGQSTTGAAAVSQMIETSPVPMVQEIGKPITTAGETVNSKNTSEDEKATGPAAKSPKASSEIKAPAVQAAAAPAVEAKPTSRIEVPVATPHNSKTPIGSEPVHPPRLIANPAATTTAAAPVQLANLKPEVLQQAQVNQTAAGQSDSGIVPPSSSSRKDGDAAKNPPPSDKSDAGIAASTSSRPNSTAASSAAPAVTGQGVEAVHDVGTAPAAAIATETKAVVPGSTTRSDASTKAASQASPPTAEADPIADKAANFSSPVQVARLVERAGQTEFRVGIQAGELGSVDIRTSMAHNQLSAEISVDRGELGRALTAELPNLHNRLAEQRVPVAQIVLQDQSAGSNSGDFRQGSAHKQYAQPGRVPANEAPEPVASAWTAAPNEASTGIDIHM